MFQGTIDLEAAIPVQATAIPDVLFERGRRQSGRRAQMVQSGRAEGPQRRSRDAPRNRRADVGYRDRGGPARSACLDDGALSGR